tara:strand:+ start:110 stop:523 length:414 start_codon:yes stop_codon:yes gene_type:complete
MAYLDIHKALTQSVIDLALGLPIAHENTDFSPENDGGDNYVSINILFDDQNTVTKTGLDDVNGFLQITNYVKAGSSVNSTYTLVDTLNTGYPHARKITSSAQTVNVQNIAVNKRGNINGWFVTDFTINFWSDITRVY